jgi:hypothetical protein
LGHSGQDAYNRGEAGEVDLPLPLLPCHSFSESISEPQIQAYISIMNPAPIRYLVPSSLKHLKSRIMTLGFKFRADHIGFMVDKMTGISSNNLNFDC